MKCRGQFLASPQSAYYDEETQEDGPSRFLRETCTKNGRGRIFHLHESCLSRSVILRGTSLRREFESADWGRMKIPWV
jgi:hypothetical protein